MLKLLLFPVFPNSPPTPPAALVLDLVDSRSGLIFGLLSPFDGVRTSFKSLSPELILFLLDLEASSGAPNVLACRRIVVVSRAGADSDEGRVAAVCGRAVELSRLGPSI